MGNSLGKLFAVTSFGESHGRFIGVVIDGCPTGLPLTEADIQNEVEKRKPSTSPASTRRLEADTVEILSGVFNEHTTGAPICLLVRNEDTDSTSYERIKDLLRPGHADYTSSMKYGGFNDYRGGGRFSGRITVGFVMAGAIAKKLLNITNIEIIAHTVEIGGIKAKQMGIKALRKADENPLKCADATASAKMLLAIEQARAEGDSLGGIIEGLALNVPVGLGEPVFDTMEGDLAKAIFAIPAVKAVEFGAGFQVAMMKGSKNNDQFTIKRGRVQTITNNSGGILGGISNGMPIVLRAAVKPTPSISRTQNTVNLDKMEETQLDIIGRHDACIVPRAVPVVSAMMAIVLCDFAMRARLIPGGT
jgi:chorismate synthase